MATEMDFFTLLHQQQLDFCHRLEVGKSFLDEEHYLSTELVMLEQNIIEEVTLESIQETEDIVRESKVTYPSQQILNTIFYGKLVEKGFLSRYGNLLSLTHNHHENIDFNSYSITKHYFYFNNHHDMGILLKAYHGDFDSILTLSNQEFNESDVFVFCICPHILTQDAYKFPILFLGFITKEFIKENIYYNNNLKFNLEIRDLLYIGGFSDYFTIPSHPHGVSDISDKVTKNQFSPVNIFLKKGEYNQVIELLEKQKDDNLPSDKLFFLQGICYYRLGENRKAIDCFLKVIKFNSNSFLSYHWLGQIYQDLEEYGRALSCYNAEIKICDLNFFAYFNRALVQTKLDNLLQALDDYNIAIKINPNFFQTFYNRGLISHQLGDHYSAIENYLQALKINPQLASGYYNLAIVYQELSNYKEAIASYEKAIKIKKNYTKAYYNLAILQANIGLYKHSIETYEKLSTIDKDFIQGIYNHKSLVLLLKKEGHIILSENDNDNVSHIADAVADVIKVINPEDKITYTSKEQPEKHFSIINNKSFKFFPVD